MDAQACRILLVDDSLSFLRSAELFLAGEPGLESAGRAGSGREALEQVERLRPDLVLMDVAMPEMNGLEATRRLKAQPGAPRVIVLTLHGDPAYQTAALDAGADGFLSKADFATGLLPLIRAMFPLV